MTCRKVSTLPFFVSFTVVCICCMCYHSVGKFRQKVAFYNFNFKGDIFDFLPFLNFHAKNTFTGISIFQSQCQLPKLGACFSPIQLRKNLLEEGVSHMVCLHKSFQKNSNCLCAVHTGSDIAM